MEENYKLIDGLQRTQTLRQYSSHPNSAFEDSGLPEELIDNIAGDLDLWSDLDCLTDGRINKLRRLVLEWVWDSRGYAEADNWGASPLTEHLLVEFAELEDSSYDFYRAGKSLLEKDSAYRAQLEHLLNTIQRQSDIAKVEVPVIIYSGPSSNLADVFVLLNTEGIKLHRYEVYAAQWLDYRYRIGNLSIIEAIWKKYDELRKAGFSLDVYADVAQESSVSEREYTLFEYLFGLGQCLTKQYPLFFKPVKVDQPSPFGFNLMSACIAGSVADKDVRHLPENIRGLDLSRLEKCIIESVEFVYELLLPMLAVQRYDGKKTAYYHADLLIVSLIAAAFSSALQQEPFGGDGRMGGQARNLVYQPADVLSV